MNIMRIQSEKGTLPAMCVAKIQTKKGSSREEFKQNARKSMETSHRKEPGDRKLRVSQQSPEHRPMKLPTHVKIDRNSSDDDTFATARTSSTVLVDESVHQLPGFIGTACACTGGTNEEMERKAIRESSEHREFYASFVQQMYFMITSCGVLSTRFVKSGRSNTLFRRPRVGLYLSDFAQFFTNNASFVPLANVFGNLLQWGANFKDEREKNIAIQQVAYFTTALSFSTSTTGYFSVEHGISTFVDHVARILVRVRKQNHPHCIFGLVKNCNEFGKFKKSTLHFVGETNRNTPAKEQAYMAAHCVLEQIMMPTSTPPLEEIARDPSAFPERLVASALNVLLEDIQRLPKFSDPQHQV